MSQRLRVTHVIVQPVLVWDDGEELTPGPAAQAMQVPLAALAGLAEEIRAGVAALQLVAGDSGPHDAESCTIPNCPVHPTEQNATEAADTA